MGKKHKPVGRKEKVTVGPFVDWQFCNLPRCVVPGRKHSSHMTMGRDQRDYVLFLYGYASYNTYLASDLWKSIRLRVLEHDDTCGCGCGRQATVIHHHAYTEANLLGETTKGMTPLHHVCHHAIEFHGERKLSVGQANARLNHLQTLNAVKASPATNAEVVAFLSGRSSSLSSRRKAAVRRRLAIEERREKPKSTLVEILAPIPSPMKRPRLSNRPTFPAANPL